MSVVDDFDRRDVQWTSRFVGEHKTTAASIGTTVHDAADAMTMLHEAMAQLRVAEVEREEQALASELGALAAVLRRRPLRLDAREEVIEHLRSMYLRRDTPVPRWQTGAAMFGTQLVRDDDLEPGVVRAHWPEHPEEGSRSPIRTQLIVIGDL